MNSLVRLLLFVYYSFSTDIARINQVNIWSAGTHPVWRRWSETNRCAATANFQLSARSRWTHVSDSLRMRRHLFVLPPFSPRPQHVYPRDHVAHKHSPTNPHFHHSVQWRINTLETFMDVTDFSKCSNPTAELSWIIQNVIDKGSYEQLLPVRGSTPGFHL